MQKKWIILIIFAVGIFIYMDMNKDNTVLKSHEDNIDIRFMIASDLHYGTKDYDKRFRDVVNWSNNESNSRLGLNYIFFNGDTDQKGISSYPENFTIIKNDYFSKLLTPYYVITGSHDAPNDTTWKLNWGYPTNYAFSHGNYTFILLNTANAIGRNILANNTYLQDQLNIYPDRKIFIIVHVSQRVWTNWSFWKNTTVNDQDNPGFQNLLLANKNIVGVFYGHDHDRDFCVFADGVYQCWDGHNDDWGVNYRGYRIVEAYDNGTIITYNYNPAISMRVNSDILYPKPILSKTNIN